MTRRFTCSSWCQAFVLVGLLSVTLGYLSGGYKVGVDLWCEGESAHQVRPDANSAWLTTRFSLDLRPAGSSYMNMKARLMDTNTEAVIGVMQRTSTFRARQHEHRLQIDVQRSAENEVDRSDPELSTRAGLFSYKPGDSLSVWMQPLTKTRYLMDDGSDVFMICSRR